MKKVKVSTPKLNKLSTAMVVVLIRVQLASFSDSGESTTVKPPNKGHIGDGPFVPCRETVLFSEVLFKPIGNFLNAKITLIVC